MDVRDGRAVHATGGDRQAYPPLSRRFDVPDGPVALASRIAGRWGPRLLYLADLDALSGRPRQLGVVEELADAGHRLRVDAAVAGAADARALLAAGAEEVVVALETLPGWERLAEVTEAAGRGRTALSLDLRGGRAQGGPAGPGAAPGSLARRGAEAGAGRVLALELERVGSGRGLDLELLRRCRAAAPGVGLTAAGGVRGPDDVRAARRAGCDECMVATALYGGGLGPATVRRLEAEEGEGGR